MNEPNWLAEQFEENRSHLKAVAYRMLGSVSDADDAVQDAWLRLIRADASGVENLKGWLTTVVARLCLDMLRSRQARREESIDAHVTKPRASREAGTDPQTEALLADSVGLAMLVVLGTLTPAERIAFVLHDMFDLSFDEIAPIVERSPAAARQLASRARQRVRGTPALPGGDLIRQRQVIDAFLAASRGGDFEALLALLDPSVVLRGDRSAAVMGVPSEIRGAEAVANTALKYRAQFARSVLVNGAVGILVAPRGQLLMVFECTIANGKIAEIDAVADPHHIGELGLAVLDSGAPVN
jgi:RNA polymerase sigma-70 factor (ECF subfamily)